MTITKICRECGKEFEAVDNRRCYCQGCLENGTSLRMRQKRYSKRYIAKRKLNDPEFKQRLTAYASRSHRRVLDKQFRQKAIQIIKIGDNVDALTEYLIANFKMGHK